MLNISLFKRIVIIGLVVLGLAYAAPNLFYPRVETHNDAVKAIELAGGEATEELQAQRGAWPEWLPSSLVNLGLDLRGGAHLLAEVQVEDVYEQRMDSIWQEVFPVLRESRSIVGTIRRLDTDDGTLQIRIGNPENIEDTAQLIRALAQPVMTITGTGSTNFVVSTSGDVITVQLSEAEKLATDDRTIQQSLEIIRRRVDEVGTREPTIQRQGEDRILIQVP
ncbi:MAG TPA: protein translocase subunit SecD, partial [Maritimibacter sp.]|nr:protein translocase subunit SecD [Maritimibacter sp.]